MTSLTRTPAALTAYLRRATWGLPRARQQEVWDELEEHVLTRIDHLHAAGVSPAAALDQALRELGPPLRVSAGMTQVYLMPKLLLSVIAAFALSAVLYALAGGGGGPISTLPTPDARSTKPAWFNFSGTLPKDATIPVISHNNGVLCITPDSSFYSGSRALVSMRALQSALESQGGRARFLTPSRLEVTLPGGGEGTFGASFTQDGQAYVAAGSIIFGIKTAQAVTVRGFDVPEIDLGRVRLRVGDGTEPEVGNDFYRLLMPGLVGRVLGLGLEETRGLFVGGMWSNPEDQTIQTGLPPGEVVMFMAREGPRKYLGDIVPVRPDGTVHLFHPRPPFRFVTDPARLSPYRSGGRINALLIRVTNVPLNDLRQGIFLPRKADPSTSPYEIEASP